MKHLKKFNEAVSHSLDSEIGDIINIISDEYPTTVEKVKYSGDYYHRYFIGRCSGSVDDNIEDVEVYGSEDNFISLLDQVIDRLRDICDFSLITGLSIKRNKKRALHMEEWVFEIDKEPFPRGGVNGTTWKEFKTKSSELRSVLLLIRTDEDIFSEYLD